MFYLRTGANGSCKTLFSLRDVRDLQLATGRPVAFNKNFKAKAILTDEFGWKLLEDFRDWEKEPYGTIFLIDEAYKDLPVRPNGQQPPKYVERLAEHRSMGFDFFMLALHPGQIDSFVRKAIGAPGWHQHLKRVGGASSLTRILQWDAVNANCEKDGSGKTAQISNRLQPKEVYEWYDSAFIHTGKVRIPKQVWWFLGGITLAAVLSVYAYKALTRNVFKGGNPQATSAVMASGPPASGELRGTDKPRPLTPAEYAASYQPRLSTLLHTAPAYDELTKPKRVPVPAACASMPSKGCKCYTQDGTPYPTDQALCLSIVRDGIFLAFAESASPAPSGGSNHGSTAGGPAAPKETAFINSSGPILPVQEVRSTVSRDAEVLSFMRKREYIK
jgi:zona occludens toxin